jgi:hypothetical protein
MAAKRQIEEAGGRKSVDVREERSHGVVMD